MKKKIAIIVGLFLVFVIAIAPAKLIHNFVPIESGVVLGSIDGSVWSGRVTSVEKDNWKFEDIKYSVSALSLAAGSLAGDANIENGDVTGQLEFDIVDQDNLRAESANLSMQASQLESLLPFPGIELAGEMSTEQLSLEYQKRKITFLNGTTRWKNGDISMNNNRWNLGEFVVDWSTEPESNLITGRFRKTNNILDIAGKVTLSPTGVLEFKGSISNAIDKNIYAALSLFADGKVQQGRLPIKFKKKIQ